jgi:peptidyl-prolyl isomerase D
MYTSSCNSVFPCGITQAQLALNDLDGALWSLTNASQLEPNDVGIKKELAAVKKKIAERDDKEKKAYARMFS